MEVGIDLPCWTKHIIGVWYPKLENCATSRLISFGKHHAHIGPLLVVVLVLFLFLSNSFNFALRLGFSSLLASRNRWRIATVTFSAMFYFQAESNAFNGRCRPSLRKTSDQGTDRHHLSFTPFTFGFGPLSLSIVPSSLSFHSFPGPRKQGRRGGRRGRLCCFSIPFLPINVVPLIPRHIRPPG